MIEMIVGPMFSGKSSEMIRRMQREEAAKRSVVLIKPYCDFRGFTTHDKKDMDFNEVPVDHLEDADNQIKEYDVVAIDEAQFFTDLVFYANKWANEGKKVILAGLNSTSELKQFKPIRDLYGLADQVTRLNAVCTECGSDHGAFSYYTKGKKSDYMLIGGAESYIALCRKCMIKHKAFKDEK